MIVYVAQTLIEDIDLNSCSVEVFTDRDAARKWANEEIGVLAMDMDGTVTKGGKDYDYYAAESGDRYVTIEIVERIVK